MEIEIDRIKPIYTKIEMRVGSSSITLMVRSLELVYIMCIYIYTVYTTHTSHVTRETRFFIHNRSPRRAHTVIVHTDLVPPPAPSPPLTHTRTWGFWNHLKPFLICGWSTCISNLPENLMFLRDFLVHKNILKLVSCGIEQVSKTRKS